jgi:aryl-alcohol dehydrogenase-like predicted oxidoreductase
VEEAETARAGSDEFGKTLYNRMKDADKIVLDRVEALAQARGVPMAQVALAWMLSKPGVTSPIVGATKPNHLEDAVASVSLKLTAEEVAGLEEAYVPHPVAGFG